MTATSGQARGRIEASLTVSRLKEACRLAAGKKEFRSAPRPAQGSLQRRIEEMVATN